MPPQPDADGGANLKTISGLRDQDAFGAIAWLWNMFGFGKKLRVLHAANRLGVQIASGYPDMDYGGRGYSCLDCEGQMWRFGSYDPWH